MPEDRRHLGTPAHVPGVRPRGLLRLVEESACTGALPFHAAPGNPVGGARRGLEVVLHRRHLSLRQVRFVPFAAGCPENSQWLTTSIHPKSCSSRPERSGGIYPENSPKLKLVILSAAKDPLCIFMVSGGTPFHARLRLPFSGNFHFDVFRFRLQLHDLERANLPNLQRL